MYLKEDLEHYIAELARVQSYRTAISHEIDGLPSGNIRKKPEEKWVELMDYTDELVEYLTNRAFTVRRELETFEKTVDALPAQERSVLRARYITGTQFKDIIKKLPMSERMVYYSHKQGVSRLDMTELDEIGSYLT